ncbi:MAG: hypothetical protein IAF38_18050 [Bacteroidia bacterium]|nr:hypothetical protein [Bacteroidia bacterium]
MFIQLNQLRTFFVFTVTLVLFESVLSSCSNKNNWRSFKELNLTATSLNGTWSCDSARNNGEYYKKTITISSSGTKIQANDADFYSGNKKYFSGSFNSNPCKISRYISSESNGLEFTYESEEELGVYSKDSIRVIVSEDYSELYVRVK